MASLACFLGVGLLFSVVLLFSWGPSQPCPWVAFSHAGLFQQPQSSAEQGLLAPHLLARTIAGGGQASRPGVPGRGLHPRSLDWEHSLATEDSIPQLMSGQAKAGVVRGLPRNKNGTNKAPLGYTEAQKRIHSERRSWGQGRSR